MLISIIAKVLQSVGKRGFGPVMCAAVIRLRLSLMRVQRRMLAVASLILICLAVLLTHAGLGAAEMPEGGHEMGTIAISICLAVLDTALFILAGFGLLRPVVRRGKAADRPIRSARFECKRVAPAARAGPSVLQVFLR